MEELARVYSRSLFEVARDEGSLEAVRGQLIQVADALGSDKELAFFFFSPYFSSREKKDALNKALVGPDRHFLNFLSILLDKHRLPVIFRIRSHFEKLWKEHNRELDVEVISAVKLDSKTLERIRTSVEQKTERKVNLNQRVDEGIVGGLVLRVGNKILDASIKHQLERLRRQVAAA